MLSTIIPQTFGLPTSFIDDKHSPLSPNHTSAQTPPSNKIAPPTIQRKMFADGSFAVALVKNQVMVVRTSEPRFTGEKLIQVHPYSPFGEGVFLASDITSARIAASDILTVLPPFEDNNSLLSQGMLELPKKSYSQFMELRSRHQKRYESLWSAWVSKKH